MSAAFSLASVDSEMPPKEKSRQTPQPTTEADSSPSQLAPAIKTFKAIRARSKSKANTADKEICGKASQPAPGTPRGRPSKESLFLQAVASKCGVLQDVVETALRAVETVALETLKEKRRFKVSFLQGKLIEKRARPATAKNLFGKVVAVAARPAKKIIKFSPTKPCRLLFPL